MTGTTSTLYPSYHFQPMLNRIYKMFTKVDLVTYLHTCTWDLVVDTWSTAIVNYNYTTCYGITPQLIKRHYPKSVLTANNIKLTRENVHSTHSIISPLILDSIVMMNVSPSINPHIQTNLVTMKQIEISGKLATDQTYHFSVTSDQCHNYHGHVYVRP